MRKRLTRTERKLFDALSDRIGEVVNRNTLLDEVWGFNSTFDTRVLDVYIGYLRKKIDSELLIKTHWGVGYSLEIKERKI